MLQVVVLSVCIYATPFLQRFFKEAVESNSIHKDYEIVYDSFIPFIYHPWGEQPCQSEPLYIPVSQLCHVTHEKQGRRIMRNREIFQFETNSKVGKSLEERYIENGCYCGESYRFVGGDLSTPNEHMLYERIPPRGQVIPGLYTWWGLYVEDPPPGPQDTLPNYLKSPPNSIYGSTAFVISFHDILKSYASARDRSCSSHKKVCLRVGGTMRYKREIAYVIIVCTTSDEKELFRYDTVTSRGEPIDMQGLVNENGVIVDNARAPLFTTKYHNTFDSYETLNFAFYFPKECDFKCNSHAIQVKNVEHSGCIRKIQLKRFFCKERKELFFKKKCPDKIDAEEWRTHKVVTEIENEHLQRGFSIVYIEIT